MCCMSHTCTLLCETPLLSLPRAGAADLAVPPGPAALGSVLQDFSKEMPHRYHRGVSKAG